METSSHSSGSTRRASSLPGITAFLGTLGGFLTWGLIGIFVGPVLTSVIYELLLAWMEPEPEAVD